ncbi:sensor histidine kinase [Streptomyces sp. NPDC050704]|uniref:sensor histidine kinase n=1 Tax=Streptomyces sp. NPDC050704 TaxID=3157219 RepID=UPI003430E89F
MPTSRQRVVRDSPRVLDTSIALLLFAVSVSGMVYVSDSAGSPPSWWTAVLLSGISCTALLLHRDRPRTTVAVTTACAVVAAALGFLHTVLSLGPLMLALYSFALRTERNAVRRYYVIGAASLVTTTELIAGPADRPLDLKMIGPAAWLLLPAAFGSLVRLRQVYLDAVRARAEHAERTRDEEARRRVAEERMRIARELHDVTAQHLALANAQAGVITHLIRTDPDRAHGILADFAETTSAALRELKSTVGLLRQADEDVNDSHNSNDSANSTKSDNPDALAAPAPALGLARLAGLTASFRSAGLAVTVITEGEPRWLSPGADHTAFRIVQEALTNVTKHAATPAARVRLDHSHDRLTITVTDDGGGTAPSPGPGTGFGLLGMRERAQSVGGRLRVGRRPEGGFEVIAELPLGRGDLWLDDLGEGGGSTPVGSA